MRSIAQERAADFFITQVDKVIVGVPNESENVLYVLLDQHAKDTEAGTEVARFLINPSGYVIWATFEQGYGEEFNAILDGYIREVGVLHPTEYTGHAPMNPSDSAA
jgi:hypothetical protein